MKNRRVAVGLLVCAIQIQGNRGEEGTTPVTTACPGAGRKWNREKKKKKLDEDTHPIIRAIGVSQLDGVYFYYFYIN